MADIKLPLSNVQMELMKLYSTGLSETDLEELRHVLAKFYAEKAIKTADRIWNEKGLTDDNMNQWLDQQS